LSNSCVDKEVHGFLRNISGRNIAHTRGVSGVRVIPKRRT
jgi:hypothetical protein